MRLLLDTHLLLWTAAMPECVSAAAKSLIEDSANELVFSVIAVWESAIKYALRRQDLAMSRVRFAIICS